MAYQYIEQGNDSVGIKLSDENNISFIPCNPDHYLWREYLAWKALGNTPEDAE
jgi:hypothetical protein